jgi:hypothetical protein
MITYYPKKILREKNMRNAITKCPMCGELLETIQGFPYCKPCQTFFQIKRESVTILDDNDKKDKMCEYTITFVGMFHPKELDKIVP